MGHLFLLTTLFLLNVLFVIAEDAFSSSSTVRVKRRADEGCRRAQKLYDALKKDLDTKAVLHVGGILTVIVFVAYTAVWAKVYFSLTALFDEPYSFLVYFLSVLLFSYVVIVLTNLISLIAVRNEPERAACALIGFILVNKKLLKPFVKLSLPASIEKAEQNPEVKEQEDYEEEAHDILEASAEQGIITEETVEMISNVLDFGAETIDDVVTHRKDIVALNINAGASEIMEAILDQKYSRIPVYEESIDDIIGILYIKDLLKHMLLGKSLEELNLRDVLREAIHLPASKKASELFKEMQIEKTHMVIAVDEYGGTAGIVTMEDLIEEIMGNISDEYDKEETPEIEKIEDDVYRINGTTDLEDVGERFDIPLPTDDYDTFGGFLISKLGYIPSENDTPEVEYEGYLFKCEKIIDRRIDSVLVCKMPEQGDE
ncbi:MAG: hemolysin family protein [Defluviitaleaceae bacterium]|nr:hemolysin family protein [Defluviitaleaceae bacterium]